MVSEKVKKKKVSVREEKYELLEYDKWNKSNYK